jgi:hypothetical protein
MTRRERSHRRRIERLAEELEKNPVGHNPHAGLDRELTPKERSHVRQMVEDAETDPDTAQALDLAEDVDDVIDALTGGEEYVFARRGPDSDSDSEDD